jgi:predicted transposase YbfD/YdcC
MSKGFGKPCPALPCLRNTPLSSAVDAEDIQQQWLRIFATLDDPRARQGIEHKFLSIVLIGVLATIGGATGWEDIELYAETHQAWLCSFLDLENGIPHADTYRRVFGCMNPEAFGECFFSWVQQLIGLSGAEVIAIDGKSVKGSYERNRCQSALHLVSAWASEHRLVLGQVKVESKSNEIRAIPALLKLLDISGCIITIDAMGTQSEIAHEIIAAGGDYVLALKANHPTLYQQVKDWFVQAQTQNFEGIEHQYEPRVESGHHRRELRKVWVVPIQQLGRLHQLEQWAGIKTVVMVSRVRRLWNKTTRELMYYLSSVPLVVQKSHERAAMSGTCKETGWMDGAFHESLEFSNSRPASWKYPCYIVNCKTS